MNIQGLISYLEELAPLAYQEGYDNAGLLVGDKNLPLQGVLSTLDISEAVVAEAQEKGCNLIVAHHPILFRGIKQLTPEHYVSRTLQQAIRNEIALYAIHTNLDHVAHGVNAGLGARLGLQELRILLPQDHRLMKLTTFCPPTHTQAVLTRLHEAGAGNIGKYSHCSFRVAGTGTFLPSTEAKPYLGQAHQLEEAQEERLELIVPAHKADMLLRVLQAAHPYEEVAYYLSPLHNRFQEVGAGMMGILPKALSVGAFLSLLKEKLALHMLRHTAYEKDIQRVAFCGGAGFFLLHEARKQGADAFVSSDVKYHEFFEADRQLLLCDVGHYESEVHVKTMLHGYIREKFPNIAVHISALSTNPVHYF